MDLEAIRCHLAASGRELRTTEIADALSRIDAVLSRRSRLRLQHARASGSEAGRLLEYIDHHRKRREGNADALNPEQILMLRETARTVKKTMHSLADLPEKERLALELRYNESQSAAGIVEALGLESPRAAYVLIDRALKRLRKRLGPTFRSPKP